MHARVVRCSCGRRSAARRRVGRRRARPSMSDANDDVHLARGRVRAGRIASAPAASCSTTRSGRTRSRVRAFTIARRPATQAAFLGLRRGRRIPAATICGARRAGRGASWLRRDAPCVLAPNRCGLGATRVRSLGAVASVGADGACHRTRGRGVLPLGGAALADRGRVGEALP